MTDRKTAISLSVGPTNCYLLAAEGGYLLIDTGYEWEYRTFRDRLAAAGVGVDEIEYLLLTHHHDDHVGFANELLDGVTVIAHESADELLRAGENDRSGGGLLNRRVYYLAKLRSWVTPEWDLTFPPVALRDDDLLVDGDDDRILRERGVDGTILHTPGHTPDSISVLLDDGTLFCGDAAMSRPLWAGIRYHTIFITDLDRYYESWRTIIESGAETIYPAHGEPFDVERLRENLGAYSDDALIERDPITDRYDDFG